MSENRSQEYMLMSAIHVAQILTKSIGDTSIGKSCWATGLLETSIYVACGSKVGALPAPKSEGYGSLPQQQNKSKLNFAASSAAIQLGRKHSRSSYLPCIQEVSEKNGRIEKYGKNRQKKSEYVQHADHERRYGAKSRRLNIRMKQKTVASHKYAGRNTYETEQDHFNTRITRHKSNIKMGETSQSKTAEHSWDEDHGTQRNMTEILQNKNH
jgi:hypothetical protein